MPNPRIFPRRKKTNSNDETAQLKIPYAIAETTLTPQSETLRLGPAAQRMFVPGVILTLVGSVLAIVCGMKSDTSTTIFYHAYLVAFVFYLTITLGSLFFVLLHHLARAGWSVTLRRLAEALCGNVFLMALLFLPIVFELREIYPWAQRERANPRPPARPAAMRSTKGSKTTRLPQEPGTRRRVQPSRANRTWSPATRSG